MEIQVSNIFLSLWNQQKNKPLCNGPLRNPEQETRHSDTLVTLSLTMSVVTDGGAKGRTAPPGKPNVETGPPLCLHFNTFLF